MITDVEEEIIETPEILEEEKEVIIGGEIEEEEEIETEEEEEELSEEEELERAYKEHKKTISEHKFTETKTKTNSVPELEPNEEFVIQVFSGLFFSLCDEMMTFLLNFFSKHKLISEDIALSETQQGALQIYFKTERVIRFIQKLKPELIGIIHMGWMYFQNMKKHNKKQDELIKAEKEKALKEKPKKKARKKKKAVKKKPTATAT